MNSDSEEAKEIYNSNFELFNLNQANNIAVNDVRKKVFKLAGDLKGKNVLFAGCGDGLECIDASEMGATIEAVDISEANIAHAKSLGLKNVNFQVMDIQSLKFKDKSFDDIFCFLSIMYCEALEEFFVSLKRLLKVNGRIWVVAPHPLIKMMKYNSKDNYFLKGKQYETWKGIKRFNYYRLTEDYVNGTIKAGLSIKCLIEPKPKLSKKEEDMTNIKYPHFLILELAK